MFFAESSFSDLYANIHVGFPRTGLRQHATQTIKITELRWLPYLGVKTLYVRALAQNEGREYSPIVLFKKVNYNVNEGDKNVATINASNGGKYSFEKLSLKNTDILLRCECKDFRYRFGWYNNLDKSLYASAPPKYESKGVGPPANPMELSGMCKHCIKLIKVLGTSGIFSE
jgi:hypothetical protein